MGLDVYLRHYDDAEKALRLQEEYQTKCNEIWGVKQYDQFTEGEKIDIREKIKQVAIQLGLDDSGEYPGETIEKDHPKYRKHYCKIGYWRSSYNEGGLNSKLRKMIGMTLYDVIEEAKDREKYEFQVDWVKAKQNIQKVIKAFDNFISKNGMLGVMTARFNFLQDPKELKKKGPNNPEEAMQLFLKHKEKNSGDYGNIEGDFFLSTPMTIHAIMPGADELFPKNNCFYIVYSEGKDEDKGEWYRQALEIVEATIDYVLKQDDPHNYTLCWSS